MLVIEIWLASILLVLSDLSRSCIFLENFIYHAFALCVRSIWRYKCV